LVGQASAEQNILLLAVAIGFITQSSVFAADPTPAPSPAKEAVTESASPTPSPEKKTRRRARVEARKGREARREAEADRLTPQACSAQEQLRDQWAREANAAFYRNVIGRLCRTHQGSKISYLLSNERSTPEPFQQGKQRGLPVSERLSPRKTQCSNFEIQRVR
jgi:hypothetical protein